MASSGCCVFIFVSNGSTSPTRRGRSALRLADDARLAGVDLGCEPMRDGTTICRFGHLLEARDLGRRLFEEVRRHLEANRLQVSTGTIVDATTIHAPSLTKNAGQARDPDMRQIRKGNQWYFGMKEHIGANGKTKIIHSAAATSANVADCRLLPDLLHGERTRVCGDQAYLGQRGVIIEHPARAKC